MALTLYVQIVTPEGVIFAEEAEGLIAPGWDGYLGMLPRHAPLIAQLGIGEVRIRQNNQWRYFAVSGGVLQFRQGRALILADAAEEACNIDVARAEQAAQRAQQRLAHRRDPQIDVARAEAALRRALNRLHVAQRLRA